VKFPDLYGNKEFVVKDRMNARYRERVDIWMEEKHEALLLGKRYTTIEIF
jgi:3D (Asp-Asp-Asp) domain-containing protein